MSDLLEELSQGVTLNGVFQKLTDVYCYIDIPISTTIEKLNKIDIKNDFIRFLNLSSVVIKSWIETKYTQKITMKNHDKFLQKHNVTIQDYIEFLQQHTEVRNFLRFALCSAKGTYIKYEENNVEYFGIDEDYIIPYTGLIQHYELGTVVFPINSDLREIPSTTIRATLINPDFPQENIKPIFAQTSF
jgi:hypothetical protein